MDRIRTSLLLKNQSLSANRFQNQLSPLLLLNHQGNNKLRNRRPKRRPVDIKQCTRKKRLQRKEPNEVPAVVAVLVVEGATEVPQWMLRLWKHHPWEMLLLLLLWALLIIMVHPKTC
jgi:hypothetical protein